MVERGGMRDVRHFLSETHISRQERARWFKEGI